MGRLQTSLQDFELLRQKNCLYVDKTRYIFELVHSDFQYFLSRPRRFGKSLFLSALKAYWEGRKDLFEGLEIIKLEEQRERELIKINNPDNELSLDENKKKSLKSWEAYPVFYMDFNKDNYKDALYNYKLIEENQKEKVSVLEGILDYYLHQWEETYGVESTDTGLSLALRFDQVLRKAYQKTGLRCVVLVDEYDTPLLDVLEIPELLEYNTNVLKGFFRVVKGCEAVGFSFFTGVTKFSKLGLFSGPNQLHDISYVLKYSEICGFTETELCENFRKELEELALEFEITFDELNLRLKQKYDGYHFHRKGKGIYNPYSLLRVFTDYEMDNYWFETGTPAFLIERLKRMDYDILSLSDSNLEVRKNELSDYRAENSDPIPLLYQSGYLTIINYDKKMDTLFLGFPNQEVELAFIVDLARSYMPVTVNDRTVSISSITRYLKIGDLDSVRDILISLFSSIPYQSKTTAYEHYFETVMYIVFRLLGESVQCETHFYKGRADVIVETQRFIYIFELKRNESAQAALDQIDEMEYALPYLSDKRKIFKIGVGFDSETKKLSDWKVK